MARSAPIEMASDASSSARSRSCCRWVAASSEKLKSVSHGRPSPSIITLAARRDRWAIPARCSLSTSAHSRWRRSSLIRSRGELAERAAVHPVHDQQRGPAAGLDHPVDAGDADACPLGHHADESLVLDRPDDRGRGPGVADVAQPGEPVRPVEQVGVPLIRAEGLDEQPPPVIGDGHERPGALRLDAWPARRRRRAARRTAARPRSHRIRSAGRARRRRRARPRRRSPRRRTREPVRPAGQYR